jgi:hypothetical protein
MGIVQFGPLVTDHRGHEVTGIQHLATGGTAHIIMDTVYIFGSLISLVMCQVFHDAQVYNANIAVLEIPSGFCPG